MTVKSEFIVRVQVGAVPVNAPDHPANVEFASGVAVKVRAVPGLKEDPEGLVVTLPLPVPVLITLRL